MPAGSSWMPLHEPARAGRAAFVVPPFVRLARTHALSAGGDAAVAVALAGSLFFSIDPSEARWRVALYLLLTLAPFAVVAPFIGPAIDRVQQGSRWVILGACALRALVAGLMVAHLDSLLLFPEAFALLVLGKGYSVAKSAYLPTTVASDADLVAANSKLAIVSPVSGAVAAAPAGLLSLLGGSQWAMAFAGLVFVGATVLAVRLPAASAASATSAALAGGAVPGACSAEAPSSPAAGAGPARPGPAAEEDVTRASTPPPAEERRTGRRRARLLGERPVLPAGVLLGASAMGLLRGSVGFLTFLIAFDLRTSGASASGYGMVVGAVGAGSIGGALLAPQLRRLVREEHLLAAALVVTASASLLAALLGGLVSSMVVITAVGVSAAAAKLAFDAVVQRDCGQHKGRAFASFESRFQVLWVVGALVGLASMPVRVGFLLLGLLAAATAVAFVMGRNIVEVARDLVTVPEDLSEEDLPEEETVRDGTVRPGPDASAGAQRPAPTEPAGGPRHGAQDDDRDGSPAP